MRTCVRFSGDNFTQFLIDSYISIVINYIDIYIISITEWVSNCRIKFSFILIHGIKIVGH